MQSLESNTPTFQGSPHLCLVWVLELIRCCCSARIRHFEFIQPGIFLTPYLYFHPTSKRRPFQITMTQHHYVWPERQGIPWISGNRSGKRFSKRNSRNFHKRFVGHVKLALLLEYRRNCFQKAGDLKVQAGTFSSHTSLWDVDRSETACSCLHSATPKESVSRATCSDQTSLHRFCPSLGVIIRKDKDRLRFTRAYVRTSSGIYD